MSCFLLLLLLLFLVRPANCAMIGKRHSHLSRLRPGPLWFCFFTSPSHHGGETVHYISTTDLLEMINSLKETQLWTSHPQNSLETVSKMSLWIQCWLLKTDLHEEEKKRRKKLDSQHAIFLILKHSVHFKCPKSDLL